MPGTTTAIARPTSRPAASASVFAREFDDRYLSSVLAQEETFPSAWCAVLDGYRGFNIIFHRGLVYALDLSAGRLWPGETGEAEMRRAMDERRCFVAGSVA